MGLHEDVKAFHEKYGFQVAPAPGGLSIVAAAERLRMLSEEYRELREALEVGDLEATVDGAVDLAYVCVGVCVQAGVRFDDAWAAVHAANMRKERNPDPEGKPVKPEGWRAPEFDLENGYARPRDPLAGVPFEVPEGFRPGTQGPATTLPLPFEGMER
jgi:predicted HAD superfamily Cof-like phosphohydrolase